MEHSVGKPFWIGFLIGPVLFLITLALFGVLQNSFAFWLFAAIALAVFGPVGGAACQVGHDLIAARRAGRMGTWDYVALAGIGVGVLAVGLALGFSNSGSNGHVFKNKGFVGATAFTAIVVIVYGVSRALVGFQNRLASFRRLHSRVVVKPDQAFAAGGFTFLFLQGLIFGLCQFGGSAAAGKPAWLTLGCTVIIGAMGIMVGFAWVAGSPKASEVGRLILLLIAGGGLLDFTMWALKLWPRQGDWPLLVSDVVAAVALIIVMSWRRE